MRKITISALLLLSLIFVSCNEFLDVMPDNRTQLDTKEKVAKLLVSAYPGSSSWMIAEFSSDNTDEVIGSFQPGSEMDASLFFWKDVDQIAQDSPAAFWEVCYGAIATANQALAAIENIGNADGNLNAQKGEALLARAFAHFKLSNIFCKAYSPKTSDSDLGIPYSEAPETTVLPKYQRGTVADVYAKIARDIEEGFPLLDDSEYKNQAAKKYHFNKQAAAAFATRFYLYYGQNEKAIEYANRVLPATNLQSVLRNWNTLAKENDFKIRSQNFINENNPANLLLTVQSSLWQRVHGPYGTGAKYCHSRFLCQTETNESQGPWGDSKSMFAYKAFSYTGGSPKAQMLKYYEFFEYIDIVAGIGYPRMVQADFTIDEALLNRAEAKALLKDSIGALNDINAFLSVFTDTANNPVPVLSLEKINSFYNIRYYYTPSGERWSPKKKLNPDFELESSHNPSNELVASTQENLIHCILQLRRIVMVHEGLRWNDIKRYGIEVYRRMVTANFRASVYGEEFVLRKDDPRRALQLPKSVISAGMEPNPR
ncbi:MAG: RagB/SusD family nutrient uptake outer membrane protein [Candidatus Symbiothrix sp.]|jgi:hypothetical protein|nr:RagB/SusD family nutrient uptake outer membrane protein [Candidatus Symbiothrix sp.]